jgi:hypothetical protein
VECCVSVEEKGNTRVALWNPERNSEMRSGGSPCEPLERTFQ